MVHVAQILEAEGRLPETMSLLDEIVALARRTRHEPALMYALGYRGTVLYWKSEYGPAEEQFVEGAETAARIGHGFGFLVCRMFRDLCRARLGRISEALAGFEESADLARRNGDRFWRPRLLAHQGWLRREIQAFEGAAAFSEEALRVARENPSSVAPETEALMNLCVDYALAGRTADSERMLRELEASRSTSMGKWLDELRLRSTSAVHWLVRGDAGAAREHAQRMLKVATPLGAAMYPTEARRLLGEIALADGRPVDAIAEATAALEGLRERPAPLEAWRILSTLGRGRLALGDAAGARAAFHESRTVVASIADGIHEPSLRDAFLGSPAVRAVEAGASRPD
jgi:tetratricopeptide (TPR) repeat protein